MSRRSPDFRRNKTIPELLADTRRPRIIPDTAWYLIGVDEDYEIPFEDGWANSGGVDEDDAQWYHSEDGEVRVKGVVTGAGEGTTIFTLPEEGRPRGKQTFTCAVIGGGSANVAVYPNGEVVLESFN
jgi:hypothetical protein